ncbi:NAD-dependent epimerase/dehydratase family protein [Marivibrio halodurans]|uniref:NAD-dependent epimerase/dehydratase family protein n=1 Tax=Marivibrio halodurans TaxID=2039722 RepID=A0A8J7S0I7_9PROT|nr:NAD-dependent epimerase/dehydratase family protein [Marivibrio halodurans]MBP5858107.1 NAD-dependent epimerase/dehydratase family protein [Marivibrio halodurans]
MSDGPAPDPSSGPRPEARPEPRHEGAGRPVGDGPVLVTGAGGFVGRAVVPALERAGYRVRPVGRAEVGEIHRGTDWGPHLEGVTAVVHLAARVHVMRERAPDPAAAFREVNLYGTAGLIAQAREAGVRRFVFMSSIKVLGDRGRNLDPHAEPMPEDPYAVSKIEAELALRDLKGPDMDAVVLRPPLVHGPGVGGNFARLMRLVARGLPLPLASVDNARSLIQVENLADAVRHALACRPDTYHPKDERDLSTPELLHYLAQAMDRPARLFPMPVWALKAAGLATGRYPEIERLVHSLTVDGEMDGWRPPLDTEEGLRRTVAG